MKLLPQFALSTACAALLISPMAFAQNAAIVNGKAIPKAQLDSLVKKSGQPTNDPQVREKAREVLITRELVIQEANNRGLTQKEAVKELLRKNQTTMQPTIKSVPDRIMDAGRVNTQAKRIFLQVSN